MHPLKPLLPTLTTLCGKVIFFSKIQPRYLQHIVIQQVLIKTVEK